MRPGRVTTTSAPTVSVASADTQTPPCEIFDTRVRTTSPSSRTHAVHSTSIRGRRGRGPSPGAESNSTTSIGSSKATPVRPSSTHFTVPLDRVALLELDREPGPDRDRGISPDHHSAGGDVPDQAELALAVDRDGADAQEAEIAVAFPPVGLLRGRSGERVDGRFDGLFFHERLRDAQHDLLSARKSPARPHPSGGISQGLPDGCRLSARLRGVS